MDINKIKAGNDLPTDINVIIEIPSNSEPIKYEFCKDSGFMLVDRFLSVAMHYPVNYGFIPHTLSDDGDPADVLVIADMKIMSGAVIRSRPIGVLYMEDESGIDEKILAVPHSSLTTEYDHIKSYKDINPSYINKIEHFFKRYKELESSKWVKINEWAGTKDAEAIINKSLI